MPKLQEVLLLARAVWDAASGVVLNTAGGCVTSGSVKRYGVIAIAVAVVGAGLCWAWNAVAADQIARKANTVAYICSETGRVFQIEMTPGMPGPPLENPKTGDKTLYPAEMCYWGKCGQKGGTAVLMNTYRGEAEPTYCPVCGHVVRFRNPKPPDDRPGMD